MKNESDLFRLWLGSWRKGDGFEKYFDGGLLEFVGSEGEELNMIFKFLIFYLVSDVVYVKNE